MKRKFGTKALSLFLTLAMCLSLVPVFSTGAKAAGSPVASVTTKDGVTTEYDDFAEAVKGWNENNESTLTLLDDIVLQKQIEATQRIKTLDLNGHGLIMGVYAYEMILSTGTPFWGETYPDIQLIVIDSNPTGEHRYRMGDEGYAIVDDTLTEDYETFTGGYITGGQSGIFSYYNVIFNGGTIIGQSRNGIWVGNSGKIIMNGGAVIGCGQHGLFYTNNNGVRESGDITINDGLITDCNGGVCSDETVTMNGGTITQNHADVGGGIYGPLVMNGGTISYNTARSGGGVCTASAHLYGGRICYNTATEDGGGIYFVNSASSITMDGGCIDHNTAPDGGGIYMVGGGVTLNNGSIRDNEGCGVWTRGVVHISGDAQIIGNTKDGERLNITTEPHCILLDERVGNAVAGITLAESQSVTDIGKLVITTDLAGRPYDPYLFSDDERYTIKHVDDGEYVQHFIYSDYTTEDRVYYVGEAELTLASPDMVARPTYTPTPGLYEGDLDVTIDCETEGATIYYTTDGTNPTADSDVYDGEIHLTEGTTTTFRAFAVKDGMENSPVSMGTYELVTGPVATPEFDPEPGVYYGDQTVTLDCDTEDATIYYTTDGSTPTEESEVYSEPIFLDAPIVSTIRAIGVKDGKANSAVAIGRYDVRLVPVAAPAFTPAPGGYTGTQSVTITCETEGATIHYTKDGTEPTALSPVYSEAVTMLPGNVTTLKAFAMKDDMADSETTSGTYVIAESGNEAVIGVTEYETLKDAIDGAREGGDTIVLLRDVVLPGGVDIPDGKEVTLDLAGRTVTNGEPYAEDYLIDVQNGGTLTITDSGEGGTLTTEKCVAVKLTKAGDDPSKPATLTVNGGTIHGGDYGISGNGTRANTDVTINGGEISAANECGVYQPQQGTLTVNGGEISGPEAVHVKTGSVEIKGGTLTGTAPAAEYVFNNNGVTPTGDALVIDNCGYPTGTLESVKVTGGTFNAGSGAKAVGSYAYTAPGAAEENEPLGGFVSGGQFSTVVPDDLCDPLYTPNTAKNPEGYYNVNAHEVVLSLSVTDDLVTPGGDFDVTLSLKNVSGTAKSISSFEASFPTSEYYTFEDTSFEEKDGQAMWEFTNGRLVFSANGRNIPLTVAGESGDKVAFGTLHLTAKDTIKDIGSFAVTANEGGTYHKFVNNEVCYLDIENATKRVGYEVTFDTDGGSTIPTQVVPYNELPTKPDDPTKDGYRFDGWEKDDEDFDFDDDNKITEDTELTAKWVKQYDVTFKYPTGDQTETVDEGAKLTEPRVTPELCPNGYVWRGWRAEDPETHELIKERWDFSSDTVTKDMDLVPVTTLRTYDINFDTAGGNSVSTITYNASNSSSVVIPEGTRTGYTFQEWTVTGSDGNWNNGDKVSAGSLPGGKYGDVTLTAEWTPNTYTIAFNGNNSDGGSMDPVSATYDQSKPLPANGFTRTGYDFDGWATESTGSKVYGDGESVKNLSAEQDSTVTLYAVWKPTTYTIDFDSNGGDPVADKNYTIESTDTLPTPTRSGYVFTGWEVTTTGGNWGDVDTVYDGNTPLTGKWGKVSLTARWDLAIKLLFVDYKYAGNGYKLMLVGKTADGALTFDGKMMYVTDDANYVKLINDTLDEGESAYSSVCAYIVASAETVTTALPKLSIASTGSNIDVLRDGEIDGLASINSNDWGLVNDMLTDDGNFATTLAMKSRMEADMITTDGGTQFGSIADINAIFEAYYKQN